MKLKEKVISILSALFLIFTTLGFVLFHAYAEEQAVNNIENLFFSTTDSNFNVSVADETNIPVHYNTLFNDNLYQKGAVLTSSKNKSYKSNAFVISDNTKDTLLLEWIPLSENRYNEGVLPEEAVNNQDTAPVINRITIKIVDSFDSSNYIEVEICNYEYVSYDYSGFRAKASSQDKLGALRKNGTFNTALGAFFTNNLFGNSNSRLRVYYDYEENSLYAEVANSASDLTVSKQLIRNFSETAGDDLKTWTGFKSKTAYLEFKYTHGLAQDVASSLFTVVDGLSLATNEQGDLISSNVDSYNKNEKVNLIDTNSVSYEKGEKVNLISEIATENFLGRGTTTPEGYTVKVFDFYGKDVLDSTVFNLDNGKWTENAYFLSQSLGTYTVQYIKDDIVLSYKFVGESSVEQFFSVDDSMNIYGGASVPEYMNDIKYKKGLKVEFTKESVLRFNSIIDVHSLTEDTPLITYIITPTELAKYDNNAKAYDSKAYEFESVTIRLEDSGNSDIYVDILQTYLKDANFKDSRMYSFTSVRSNMQEYGNMRSSGTSAGLFDSFEVNHGCAVSTGFLGIEQTPIKFYYDFESMQVLVSPAVNKTNDLFILRDLDSENHLVNDDRLFKGFPSGKVKLSISFKGLNKGSGNILIYDINGIKLDSDIIKDESVPAIFDEIEFNRYSPKGEVGVNYPLPKVFAYDTISGDVSSTLVEKLYYIENNGSYTEITYANKSFVPSKAGDYVLVCNAIDFAGNRTNDAEYKFTVEEKLPYLKIVVDGNIPISANLNEIISLPNGSIYGGSYVQKVDVNIITPSGKTIAYDQFYQFKESGVYIIKYSAVDYIGNKTEETHLIKVNNKDFLFDEISIPVALIKDMEITLPNVSVFDNNYKQANALVNVYITEKDSERIKLNTDFKYTPTKDGQVKIEYEFISSVDAMKKEIKTYYTEVINAIYAGDYFYLKDGMDLSYVEKASGAYHEVMFSCKQVGSSLTFINPLPVSVFKMSIATTIESKMAAYTIRLTDSLKANQVVEIKIKDNDGTAYAYLGKEYFKLPSTFNNGGTLGIKLKNQNQFYCGSKLICEIQNYANGLDFNGFDSGFVYMTVICDELAKNEVAEFYINDVINQSMFFKVFGDESACDYVTPSIIKDREFNLYQPIGKYFTLPRTIAYDVFGRESQLTVSLIDPDGQEIYSGYGEEKTVRLEKYGKYSLVYFASDSNYNPSRLEYTITCFDAVAPQININGEVKTQYKVGETLKKLTVEGFDFYSEKEKLIVKTYVLDLSTGELVLVSGNYNFSRSGKYVLRYYVEDEFGNYSIKNYDLTVS